MKKKVVSIMMIAALAVGMLAGCGNSDSGSSNAASGNDSKSTSEAGSTSASAFHAAERLEKEGGWKVEVIDIRSLIPLDKEAIFESVKKTSKALVVHEDKVFSGFGAELAAMISGEMFRYLDGPVQRVGSTFTPVGFNPILEKEILPDEAKIYEAARRLLEY